MAAGSFSRFIFAVSAALTAAVSGEISLIYIILLALLSAFLSWGGRFREIIKIAKLAVVFFLLVFILHLFSGRGKTIFEVWILNATADGAASGFLYGLKVVAFVYSAYIIFYKVDPVELVNPLERAAKHAGPLGKYISAFAISFYLAMRFLPDLTRQARTTMMAFKSRGINMQGSLGNKARVISMLMTSVFVGAFKKAEAVSVALNVKGYSSRYFRAVFPPVRLQLSSIFVMLVSISMIVAGWLSR